MMPRRERELMSEVSSMTVNPVPAGAPVSAGAGHSHTQLARWAVGLAGVVAVVVTVSYAIVGVSFAVGGSDAISDNWFGMLGAVALLGGLLASLVAFGMAVVARVKHEQWALVWLPLCLFPGLLVIVVLAETLWLE